MSPPPDNTLSYAPPPRGFQFPTRRTFKRIAIVASILLLAFLFLRGPTSGQIRLDTGDLRYCWYGIPLAYDPMPEPHRSRIIKLAALSPAIPAKWVTCVTYPLPTTNNTDGMCEHFYEEVSVWTKADPHIARWALEDIAKYVQTTHATHGLPPSCNIEWPVNVPLDTIDPDWRNDEQVQYYCSLHHYTPPPK